MDADELEARRTQIRTGGCAAPSPRGTVCGRTAAHPDDHADGTGYTWSSDDPGLLPTVTMGGIRVEVVILADGPQAGYTCAVPLPAPPVITVAIRCDNPTCPAHGDTPHAFHEYRRAFVNGHPSRDDQGRCVYAAEQPAGTGPTTGGQP